VELVARIAQIGTPLSLASVSSSSVAYRDLPLGNALVCFPE